MTGAGSDAPARSAGASRATAPDASMRIVVLHGRDSYLRVERTRQLVEALREHFGSIDRFEFDGATTPLATLLDELQTYGLLSSHKLVILDAAEVFMASEERRRAMERYAARPMAEATLLMRATGTWRPGNFDKLVEKVGAVFKCEAPSERDAVAWCRRRAERAHSAVIDEAVASLLVEKIGTDLARLDAELEKLATAAGGTAGAVITREVVGEFVGLSREEQAWEIQATLLEGSPRRALEKLDELLGVSRAPEVMIAWSVTDLLRKLHDAARLREQGGSDGEIGRALRLWGPQQGAILRASRSLGSTRAAELLEQALQTEVRMRSGFSGDDRRTIEGMLVSVCEVLR